MAKEKRATWWKMFAHQRAAIEAVSDAEVGKGLKAAFRYFDGEPIKADDLSQAAFIVFSVIRPYTFLFVWRINSRLLSENEKRLASELSAFSLEVALYPTFRNKSHTGPTRG